MDQPITNGLTITLPSRGETDWDENIKTYCFIPISAHKHEGNGSGNKLRNEALYNTLEHGAGKEAVDTNVIRDLAITRAKLAAALEADLATLETDSQGLKDFVGYIASPTYDPSVSGTLLSRLLVIEPLAINGIASLGSMLASDGTWAGFGSMSYYMEGNNDLTNNLLDLDTQVRTNRDDIDTSLTDVATLQSDVTSLQNRSLSSLSDVSSAFPSNGQALAWNDASNSWQPQTISGGSGGGVAENSFVGIVTEWQEYTPTLSGFSVTSQKALYRRVGDTLEIIYSGNIDSVTSTIFIELPTGLSIDTNRISSSDMFLGTAHSTDYGVGVHLGAITKDGATNNKLKITGEDGQYLWNASVPFTWATSDIISFTASVPILGWDAVGLIDQSGSVDVVLDVRTNPSPPPIHTNSSLDGQGNPIGGWQVVPFGVVENDTVGGWNASTNQYTIPETGYYDITGAVRTATSSGVGIIGIFIDGVSTYPSEGADVDTWTNTAKGLDITFTAKYLQKGQTVEIQFYQATGGNLTYGVGNCYFQLAKRNSSQAIISGVGSDINYISNAKAIVNLAGWNEYDGTTAIPSGAITGTASLTLERNEVNPLRGAADFKLTTTSASLGEGVAYDFSVQRADLSKKMLISFEYDTSHSGYDDGDVKVFVYDVTNSKIIRVNGEDLRGGKGTHFAQFQTSANGSDYRLLFHVTSANVYSIYLDDIKVSPIGVNDSVSSQDIVCTSNGLTSEPTITSGNEILITQWNTPVTDTTNSFSNGIFTVPETGYYDINFGLYIFDDTAASMNLVKGLIFIDTTGYRSSSVTTQDVSANAINVSALGAYLTKGQQVSFKAYHGGGEADNKIRLLADLTYFDISKRPSLALPESVGSGRDIYVVGRGSGGSYTITAETERIPFTILEDSTGSMSTTDNGPDTFTVPETGSYTIEGNVACSLDNVFTTQTIVAYVNGNLFRSIQTSDNATDRYKHFSAILRLNKGDVLDFRFSPGSAIQLDNISTYHWIHIEKLSSAQVVLDSGSDIVARYSLTSTLTVNDLTPTTVPFNLKHFDTTNSFSNGIYTVPETGYYDVNAIVALNDSSQVINKGCQLAIHVDNVEVIRKNYEANSTNTADADSYTVSDLLFLEKDQELKIVMSHNNGVSITLTTVASRNVFSIAKRK